MPYFVRLKAFALLSLMKLKVYNYYSLSENNIQNIHTYMHTQPLILYFLISIVNPVFLLDLNSKEHLFTAIA